MMSSKTPVTSINRKFIKRAILVILAVFVFCLVVWSIYVGYHVYDLSRLAKEIQQQKEIQLDYDWASTIHRISNNVNAIQTGLSPFYPVFHLFPDQTGLGHLLRQVEPFSRYTAALINCAETAFGGIQPIISVLQDKSSPADVGQIVESLGSHALDFQKAQGFFQSAADLRPALDPTVLPSSIKNYYEKLDANFEWLGFGLELLQALPGLAGQNQPKVYLVLAQNYDEIRATGGFISGIGTIEVASGKIENFALGDSYTVDDFSKGYPRPPMPIERFMLGGYWVTRDGNWSPDFPTAAQDTQHLYTLSTGVQTDGVIAFDQEAVRELVAIFGPLKISSLSFPITAENVEQYMHDAWAPDNPAAINQEWWLHRKDFMKEMGGELLDAMIGSRDINQLASLAGALKNLIRSGHLLVFFNAPEIQAELNQVGLSGEINFQNNLAIMLVDSNIGFNKMDGVIQRSIEIKMDISDLSQPMATITLNYDNPVKKDIACKHIASYGNGTYADLETRCYWDYFRVYLPAGSQLISMSSPEIPPDWLLNHETVHNPTEVSTGEGGSVVIGGMTVVPTNTSQQVVLKVRLPQTIVSAGMNGQKQINIEIYKQPGLRTLPVSLALAIPPDFQACQNSSFLVDNGGGQLSWNGSITQTFEQNLCLSSAK